MQFFPLVFLGALGLSVLSMSCNVIFRSNFSFRVLNITSSVISSISSAIPWILGRVSQLGLTSGRGSFGQNGQKLHENYKINIFGAKQWWNMGGDKPIFWLVRGDPPSSPPTRGNPARIQFLLEHCSCWSWSFSGFSALVDRLSISDLRSSVILSFFAVCIFLNLSDRDFIDSVRSFNCFLPLI